MPKRVKVRVKINFCAYMPKYLFHTLGQFEVRTLDGPVELPRSKKARALLAYLAVKRRPQTKDHLVQLFFAETRDPKGGLRWTVSRLRAALDRDFLLSTDSSITLRPDAFEVDIELLSEAAAANPSAEALGALERSIDGKFLADLHVANIAAYEAWRLAQQVDCTNIHTDILERIINKSLGKIDAVESARKLVDLDTTRESSWSLLVQSLLAMNQLADARQMQRLAVEQLERDGVRLTGRLEKVWGARETGSINSAENAALASSEMGLKPRVAILACHYDGDAEESIAEKLTQVMHRACNGCKLVTVLAPTVSAQLGNMDVTLTESAQSLGVDLLLHASLSSDKDDVRVEVEIVDTKTSGSLFRWSQSVPSMELENLPRLFEPYLSARMEIDLPIALVQRLRENPQKVITARDQYLLALPRMFSAVGFDPVEAHELLESALSRQPYFGQACCALSLIRMFMPQCNDNDEQLEITLSLARRAVEICQDDAFVLGLSAATISHVSGDTETGIDLARRALSINPYSVMAGISAAMVHHYHGDNDACLAYIDAVEANADTDPVSFFCFTCRAMAYYQTGDYKSAVRWSKKAVGHNPTFVIALRYLLASFAMLGAVDEARALADQMIDIDPSENIAFFHRRSAYRLAQHTDHLCEGLRKGGLPETA